MKHFKCCICGEVFWGYGNNAYPYAQGTCCDTCNAMHVIPLRFEQAKATDVKNEDAK